MRDKINMDTDGFFQVIKNHLHSKVRLSVIRYGDGETMMLDDIKDDTAFILKKVLGYVPSDEDIKAMKDNLVKAYEDCDWMGIPTERHLNRKDNWGKSITVFNRVVGSSVLVSKDIRLSQDVFHDMLSKGYFNELLMNKGSLYYVSCRNLDKVFREKFNIKEVRSFIISPEPTYTSGYVGLKHFPDQFNLIKEWIKTLDCKGSLCLVGAGIPGKIYTNWFRDQGGVALDVGSVFDAWSGHRTRGPGRGLDAIDETNKL